MGERGLARGRAGGDTTQAVPGGREQPRWAWLERRLRGALWGREASQDWAALKGREGTQAQTSRSASVSEEAVNRARQPSVMKAACNTQEAGRQFPTILVYWENKKPKPS